MKKIFTFVMFGVLAVCCVQAQQPQQAAPAAQLPVYMRPTQAQRKEFKQRNKEIRRLAKKYRKATSAQEKAAVKAQLAQIISDTTDAGMAWALERVAAEKKNLAAWEQKLQERQKNLDEIKARRVDEILSGEGERRFKLAQKRWKKEMKDFKKSMK